MNRNIVRVARGRRKEDLLESWRDRSGGGAFPMGDWDNPANGALLDAVLAGDDTLSALQQVAQARHEAGFTFAECTDDLRNLIEVLPRPLTRGLEPFSVVTAIGDVYLEASYDDAAPTPSGLPDETYLGHRMRETYRLAERQWPWVLAVIQLNPLPDRFDGMLRQLEVVAVLQRTFTRAATLGALGDNCLVALAADPVEATAACVECAAALTALSVTANWRVQALPEDPADVDTMLHSVKRRW